MGLLSAVVDMAPSARDGERCPEASRVSFLSRPLLRLTCRLRPLFVDGLCRRRSPRRTAPSLAPRCTYGTAANPPDSRVNEGCLRIWPRLQPLLCRRLNKQAGFVLSTSQMFRNAFGDPMALAQSSLHLDGRWESIHSLRFAPPPGATSLLPLPRHWLLLPLASQVRFDRL